MRRTVWVSALVAVVILGALVLNIMRGGEDASSVSSGGEDTTTAAPVLAARPECPAPRVAGVALPCLGQASYGTDSATEWTVVTVWAWWCGPCRDELPYFVQLKQDYPDLTVVGVHADTSPTKGVAFLEAMGIDLPSYQDDANLFAGTLGLPGVIPQTLVLRGDDVVATFIKPMTSYEELEAAVQEVRA